MQHRQPYISQNTLLFLVSYFNFCYPTLSKIPSFRSIVGRSFFSFFLIAAHTVDKCFVDYDIDNQLF